MRHIALLEMKKKKKELMRKKVRSKRKKTHEKCNLLTERAKYRMIAFKRCEGIHGDKISTRNKNLVAKEFEKLLRFVEEKHKQEYIEGELRKCIV
jgi:hypothetical protein